MPNPGLSARYFKKATWSPQVEYKNSFCISRLINKCDHCCN